MTKIETQRMTADIDGDFVVFLIGMRINSFWKIHKWLPVSMAMPKMLQELSQRDQSGLLSSRVRWLGRNIEVVQYWRSFEKLHNYAHDKDAEHLPAWAKFNRLIKNNNSVGIWHETFLIEENKYETVYRNMPTHGLADASEAKPAKGHFKTASGRLNGNRDEDLPVDEYGTYR
jgi:hypothetical protein